MTFITVVISAFRVSHLNIVAAIRDLPEEGARRRRRLSVLGALTTTAGLVLTASVVIPIVLALLDRKSVV